MSPRPLAVLMLLVAALLAGAVSGAQDDHGSFAAVTHVLAHGSQHGTLRLPHDATLAEASLLTTAENAALLVQGPSGFWLYKSGDAWAPRLDDKRLEAGTYHIYVVTSPPSEATAVLRLDNLTGSATVTLQRDVRSHFGQLAKTLDLGLEPGLHRHHGEQPFPGKAYTGFFAEEWAWPSTPQHREMRYSNSHGIWYCIGDVLGGIGLGSHTIAAGFWDGDHEGPLNLTYYWGPAAGVTGYVKGLWVELGEGDALVAAPPPYAPPGWDVLQANPVADVDAFCAQRFAGWSVSRVLGAVG